MNDIFVFFKKKTFNQNLSDCLIAGNCNLNLDSVYIYTHIFKKKIKNCMVIYNQTKLMHERDSNRHKAAAHATPFLPSSSQWVVGRRLPNRPLYYNFIISKIQKEAEESTPQTSIHQHLPPNTTHLPSLSRVRIRCVPLVGRLFSKYGVQLWSAYGGNSNCSS